MYYFNFSKQVTYNNCQLNHFYYLFEWKKYFYISKRVYINDDKMRSIVQHLENFTNDNNNNNVNNNKIQGMLGVI